MQAALRELARGRDELHCRRESLRSAQSLGAKGLALTVIVTLALGIGANAAIFSVVRSVLLRPLVNRDADRLIYIRQTAEGIGTENLTFSVPEMNDFKSRVTRIAAFGDFSTVDFTLIGFGHEPRVVKAGVVNGSFFEVMGLRPVLGRLLNAADDGPGAAGAVVLTHRFWTTVLQSDATVIGQTIRLGPSTATVVGVLEPSVPYPEETQLIANVVTSPHHLGATMVTDRTASYDGAVRAVGARRHAGSGTRGAHGRARGDHGEHPDAYAASAQVQLQVRTLSEQLASPARTILLVLLAATAIVFVIACSNVANLILARSVRRETELAVRAALGAGRGALRRTLLAESLLLCSAGAALGLMMADSLVTLMARYAARFSVRALEATVDDSVLWLGAGLAMTAAVLLAFVPRLPSSDRSGGWGWLAAACGSRQARTAVCGCLRRPRSRVRSCCWRAPGCWSRRSRHCRPQTPAMTCDRSWRSTFHCRRQAFGDEARHDFVEEATRRIGELPGVQGVAAGMIVPWRDRGAGVKCPVCGRGVPACGWRRKPDVLDSGPSRLDSSKCSVSRSSRAETLPTKTVATPSLSPWSARAWRSACSRTATRSIDVCGGARVESRGRAASSASSRMWMTRTSCKSRR